MADFLKLALDQLGVKMTPFWAWVILIIVAVSLIGNGIWIVIHISQALRGRRSQNHALAHKSEASQQSRPTAIRIRKGADDARIEDSAFIGDIDGIVNEGGKRMQSKGNHFWNISRKR